MKKFAFALVCTFAVVGYVVADEFNGLISKVEGDKITFQKKAGFGGGGLHGYNALEGTFLGGCIFSGRAAGRALARDLS